MIIAEAEGNANSLMSQNTGNKINICYASSKAYAKYLALSMATVISSKNPEDDLCFYILDGGLDECDRQKIRNLKKIADFNVKFINVDSKLFQNCPVNASWHIKIQAYYRLLIPDFIPELDKILYLDCDVKVKNSLKELFNVELDDFCLAAVPDVGEYQQCRRLGLKKYFNSGVLVMNLSKLREIKFTEKLFDWVDIHKEELKFYDQDVINMYFPGKIKELDLKWNCQGNFINKNFNNIIKNACIVHFISSEKRDFVYCTLALCLKTDYKFEFLKLYAGRIFKFIVQWFFRVRNYDENKKQITIFGMDFYIKRKG